MVLERETVGPELEARRKVLRGDAGGFMAHQVFAREVQEALVLALGAHPPLLEGGSVVHGRRHARGIKRVDQLFVDQDVRAARLVLEPFDLGDEPPVVREERCARLELAAHQRLADEDLVRRGRVDGPVRDPAVRVDRQPVERSALERDHLAAPRVPLRLLVAALDEMAADIFEPARLDRAHRAREEARRLHQLGGRDPTAGLFHRGARMDPELDAARAGVARLRLIPYANVAKQPGGQCTMDGAVALRRFRVHRGLTPAELAQRTRELPGDIAPLAHARHREEILAAGALHLVLEERGELEETQEIRALVRKARMALVGGRGLVERPLARVLHRERRGDEPHLRDAAFLARGDQHAADAWVERQARELGADRGELVRFIDRAELSQQRITIGDGARRGRVEEREVGDFAKAQAFGAQDHRGER